MTLSSVSIVSKYLILLNGILMLAIPISFSILVQRRWRLPWSIWWIGAATFVISQVGHLPFNYLAGILLNRTGVVYWSDTGQLLFNALFAGLSAGIFEETSRYFILRYWAKSVRIWNKVLFFGAGHGGMEAILVGLLALYGSVQIFILTGIPSERLASMVGAQNLDLVRSQLDSALSTPWHMTLIGALERLLAIPCQIALAVLVLQVFVKRRIIWLFLAIAFHTIIDAVAVIGSKYLSPYAVEGTVAIFTLVSAGIIYLLHHRETVEHEDAYIPPVKAPIIVPKPETRENLDNSPYE